jgi:hypothetical protein
MSDEPLADIAQTAVLDTNAVTKVFIKIRDKRAQLKKAFEDEDKVLKEKQVILEGAMLDFLQLHNLRSAPTDNGVFYRQEEIIPTGIDWAAFYEWVRANDAFDFLERRIKKTSVKTYMEEHDGAIPPGVSVLREYVVRVRRS